MIGDWGAGTPSQRAVAQGICAALERDEDRIVVTTGDNFYDPDGTATPRNFTEPMRCLLRAKVQWRASWGNHDAQGRSTKQVLGASRWYRWRVRGAEFFMLDSNNVGDADQRSWLAERLAASRARAKVVVFHHPPYTVGSVHGPDERVQREWVPLFRRHRVTLVLSGHNHLYEHHIVAGLHYVVSGGGGNHLYRCDRSTPRLIRCEESHHFLLVTIREDAVTVRAVMPSGRVFDRFRISV